ncbi:hypothetical protein JCM4814A_89210 [Streptomyces phaeofaciens JCM 4814]|uniref:Uncharacterized protein n=1 Tax=Streptomyces phaeofaciens TaxID=68254 RepID=A0A918HLS2_9ACTN|nr:hypothetical protein [Streptomyces phaeofaciens]GGT79789.1 hypothetical protein GCM10010226_67670 [Streptomyces phaeofaciens]
MQMSWTHHALSSAWIGVERGRVRQRVWLRVWLRIARFELTTP